VEVNVSEVPASGFYTGLVAELYAPLRSTSFEPDRYAELIARHGEPALELGCGDGDPLLDLVARGLDVDGVDSSDDMIGRLHRRAAARDLEVDVRVADMRTMRLPRTYRTIFLAGPTFNLLPDDAAMAAALASVARALAPGGTAVVPLFVPEPVDPDTFGVPRRQAQPDGWISVQVLAADRDEASRTQTVTLRYERLQHDLHETLDRDWVLHWIDLDRVEELAQRAGLRVVSAPEAIDGTPRDVVLRHDRSVSSAR
jgi:SAM-dependent methyltransferase